MREDVIITAWLALWLTLLGGVLGSFLDCAISRWLAGEPPFRGRSHCNACGRVLAPGDLVPVLSYLFRWGRCKYCGAAIPRDCLWAELAGAAGFLCLTLRVGLKAELGQWLIWYVLLLALSLADGHRRIIPDRFLLALAANRCVWLLLLGEYVRGAALVALTACAVPAALLALVLLAERLLGREVMGGGDVKLLLALALYFTWAQLLLTLLAGCLLGLAWAARSGGKKGTAVAFGPFLSAGAVLTLCFGDGLIQWYLGFF